MPENLVCYDDTGKVIATHIFPNRETAIFAIPRIILSNPKCMKIKCAEITIERDAFA